MFSTVAVIEDEDAGRVGCTHPNIPNRGEERMSNKDGRNQIKVQVEYFCLY